MAAILFFFSLQDPLSSSWLGYSALTRGTRVRAPVAEFSWQAQMRSVRLLARQRLPLMCFVFCTEKPRGGGRGGARKARSG